MDYDKEQEVNQLGEKLRKEYNEIIVDYIVFDEEAGKILIQKRSATRTLFPNAWEFPGGHLEPNEDITTCIKRLIYEEGQQHLKSIVDLVHLFTWDSDKDVVNLQFLVRASGTFAPNKGDTSEHCFISGNELKLLLEEGQETPIYRGAFYAFEYISMMQHRDSKEFSDVLFFDQIVASFFNFLRIAESAPKITLGKAEDKKFKLDKEQGALSIAPSFLKTYDNFACASIILHQAFHNYCQNILTFDDVQAIRGFLGKNVMFYVDIVADVHTFLFLERYCDYSQEDYARLCWRSLKEYQNESLEASKLTRLLGSLLTIAGCKGQNFDVVLPVLDDKTNALHILTLNKTLSYQSIKLEKGMATKLATAVIGADCKEEDFLAMVEKVISITLGEK